MTEKFEKESETASVQISSQLGKSAVNSDLNELSQSVIDDFANRFPNPPKGVWRVGDTLLDGMCQVLPFSQDKLYAEGGVGLVQRVRRKDWNIDLIVKSPKPGVVLTETGKESFERECQTWIELGLHANIVSCYFVRRIDGIPRLFAELAPDGTLNDWILDKRLYRGNHKEALARILDVAIQFAWGLEHAHRQGLLHLDVKPSNVMTSGSTIKVTDFGLSKFATETAGTNKFATNYCDGMTPSYCSPEQFQAFQIYRERRLQGASANQSIATIPMTKQSDVWSWAISVLTMFHGHSPCKKGGQTAAKVFEVFLKSQETSPRPTMPHGIIDLLRWCFQEKPSDRPDSMQTVANQIVQIYQDEIGAQYPRRQPQNTTLTAESFSNRAISLLDLGKTNEALDLLRQATDASPNQPQIVFNYVLAQWRVGNYRDTQVVRRLQELIQNRADDPTSFYVCGLANLERGNLKSSLEVFKHGLELDPKRKDIRRALEETEKIEQLDSRCVTQYTLYRNENSYTPALYVDKTKEFILVKLISKDFALIKIHSGQILANFIPKSSDAVHSSFTAVSRDYKWNLESYDKATIIVSSVIKNKDATPKYSYQFEKTDWGSLNKQTVEIRGRRDSRKNVDLSSDSINIRSFTPQTACLLVDETHPLKRQKIADGEQMLTSFAISSNGNWVAVGNANSLISVWEVAANRCLRTFRAAGGVVEALWFDPKKRVVISLAKGNILQLWSVALICNFQKKIRAPHLLCLVNSSEELQERQTQFETAYLKAKEAVELNELVKLSQICSSLRDVDGWKMERRRFDRLLERRIPRSYLADVEQLFQVQAHDSIVSTLASSWNASFFVSAGKDGTIRVWSNKASHNEKVDKASSKELNSDVWIREIELDYHSDWIRSIALSPNNRFLVSGGWDQNVALWDLATGKRIRTLSEKVKNLTKLVFAPDGRTIAAATANGAVTLWDLGTNEPLIRLNVGSGYTRSLVFNRNGSFFVTATDDSIVRFWTGRSGLPFKEVGGFSGNIRALDLTGDAKQLVVGCSNGKIYVIDLTSEDAQSRIELVGHLGEINCVKLFADGNWLVSASKDKTIRFWNLRNGNEVFKITSVDGEFCDLTVDYLGQTLIAGAENGVIRFWNLFWEYDLEHQHTKDEIKSIVSSLKEYYATSLMPQGGNLVPQDYYGHAIQNNRNISIDKAELTPEVVRKIYTEIIYRGFCELPFGVVQRAVEASW